MSTLPSSEGNASDNNMRLLDSGVARYTFSIHNSTDGKPKYRLHGQKAVRKMISAKALWNGQSNSYLYLGHCRGGYNTAKVCIHNRSVGSDVKENETSVRNS
ncbi:hypothetical protein J1614_004862 [Plenodomus biglobosus]|nr:hypothetical protein J1614_004862 [Plenodomus biglobosus]